MTELPFEYSAAVGEYGTPVGGAAVCALILCAMAAASKGLAAAGIGVLVVGSIVVVLGGHWLAKSGVLALPLMRRKGVNLEATRGDDPDVWLVAHIDSKSQPVPLLVRAAGVVLLSIAWLAAVVLSIANLLGHASPELGRWVVIAAALGTVPVIGSVVGARSAGAIDNASGVAAVLSAAAIFSPAENVGVLITDAEELGLAGARAWCAETTRRRAPVINCDGVDDVGGLTLMWTRPRSPRLERFVLDASDGLARIIPLVPGVLVDGVAFSDAGWECVTVSRGSLATLRRIHTRGDDLTHLEGTGLTPTALVLARVAHNLMEQR